MNAVADADTRRFSHGRSRAGRRWAGRQERVKFVAHVCVGGTVALGAFLGGLY